MSNFNGFTGDNDPVYYSRKAEKADGPLTNEDAKQAGNSPVIPDGSASMLRRWLAFGRGMQNAGCQLPHNLISETEEILTAAPQLPGSEPTVPGKWIPASEQMPENKPGSYEYLVFETLNNRVNHDYWNVPDKGDDAFTPFWNYYGGHVTHWMPLPDGPRESK